jgi:hypothetical protein
MVGVSIAKTFWGGRHTYAITFDRPVSGHLMYTLPAQGQQFVLAIEDGGPVRIILPPGYTTGDRILGIARPPPDEFISRDNGTVLTWLDTSRYSVIEVSYYRENAPLALKRIFSLLVAMALILLVDYYISIRRLRSMREEADKWP